LNNYRVTILLATFNRAHLIGDTLISIKSQTYKNWECIIVDDHSNDDTPKVVSSLIADDSRFSYFLKTKTYKKGLSGTRNYGLDLARTRNAKYIQFFDDDDIMHPQKLELQITPFIENPSLNFTVCKFEKLIEDEYGDLHRLQPEFNLHHQHLGDAILTGRFRMNNLGPLWNMNVIDQFRFDEELAYAEEWELFTRIGYLYPSNYKVVDEFLFTYRKHNKSLTLGGDNNYERRKTSAIIRIKIFEFLTIKKLHTPDSIRFLTESFLLKAYHPELLKELYMYCEQDRNLSSKYKFYIKVAMSITKYYRKIIIRLGSWI
jgi:GalNAc5-diNAcBac-PP-undecaprenol beta-1,3-glucosyltransferase